MSLCISREPRWINRSAVSRTIEIGATVCLDNVIQGLPMLETSRTIIRSSLGHEISVGNKDAQTKVVCGVLCDVWRANGGKYE